jgi:uncharacterized membrane protein YfcA
VTLLLYPAIFLVALLYASVGHAGASGYIAVLTLLGFPPEVVRPTALTLNVAVAVLGTWTFWRAGHLRPSLLWPFALTGAPFALLGGALRLPTAWFQVLIGLVLLASAARLLLRPPAERPTRAPPRPAVALATGAALGLMAGLTGTGGGIFLTPLLLFAGWASTREAAAVSAAFILVNSIAGLIGFVATGGAVPGLVGPLLLVVAVGGGLGAWLGARRLAARVIATLLAAVLIIAGFKLLLT